MGVNDIGAFIELIRLYDDVFEMENFRIPPKEHLQKILSNDSNISIVALMDNKVIGGLSGYILDQYYSEKPLFYLYDLAVAKTHQRKGIGKQLINFLLEYCMQKGFEEAYVQADKVDEHALAFYRGTRMKNEEEVHQFSCFI